MKNIGIIYALAAYLIWGVVPIFWRQIEHIPSVEIVAHRMIWSCMFALIIVVGMSQWRQFFALLRQPATIGRLLIASVLVSINWGVYIWAVNHGHIVEGSMGYFINPLLNVLLGVVLFKETLRRNQWLAIGFAGLGVGYLIFVHGEVPFIALTLAVSFALYGAAKKSLKVPAPQGMAIETGLMLVPAIIWLAYLQSTGNSSFGIQTTDDVMLVLGGALTLAPLLFFAAAAQRISLTALGMTQYLGPTLQLIIGVMIYNEPFGTERQIAFGFIWAGLVVYTIDQLQHRRRRKPVLNSAGVVIKAE